MFKLIKTQSFLMQNNNGKIYQVGPDRKSTLILSLLKFIIACISYHTKAHIVIFPEILNFSNVSGACIVFNITDYNVCSLQIKNKKTRCA
jgi:hypothetical protein